jgi:hypothetical protein
MREAGLDEYVSGLFQDNTDLQMLAKRDPKLLAGFAAMDPHEINGVLAPEVGTHSSAVGCLLAV